jgi:hypothetical protein
VLLAPFLLLSSSLLLDTASVCEYERVVVVVVVVVVVAERIVLWEGILHSDDSTEDDPIERVARLCWEAAL